MSLDADLDSLYGVAPQEFTALRKQLVAAAKKRGEALDHVLFVGPPGLGKTTLAQILATEMGVSLRITSGPAIERAAAAGVRTEIVELGQDRGHAGLGDADGQGIDQSMHSAAVRYGSNFPLMTPELFGAPCVGFGHTIA